MKLLTQAEEDAHYQAVLKNGATWGTTGLAAGMAGAIAMNRYWAGFRGLTLPLKAFAVTSVATFALIVGADRGSRAYDQQIIEKMGIGWGDESLERKLGLTDRLQEQKSRSSENMSKKAKWLEHFKDHQYHYVLGSWAASMVGSFGFIATQPMPFTQKLVQARMYAQGLTVAVVMASAALASASTGDAGLEDEIQGRKESLMYKFKRGSPHELSERRLREQHRREYVEGESDE
ncbi:uncharacterized protein MELLADRAFT_89800 [Melampsora larici-populina 98AG31]|uniref:HIG1 domain-containing protein n=1 Tax=Melampsora larici-populina (strain 98AG31 / pathotype 3-4-7) TaxID=747676 RepID=F4RUP1_MELLP|nr:uncharacterized protein MELLADRAFT_89800 [Melampsora larici-populina 98AG31]EGG03729.1 hypothetical protein MELLADRAFT_89800 [Melampsora larici-populina 98AG31]